MVSHRHGWAKLNKSTSDRLHMLRNMVTSLIKHERIMTTHAKAKACQRVAERYISLAKENTLNNRRNAAAFIYEQPMVYKLFNIIGPRYINRNGGYTRVVHVKRRERDDASMSYLELIDRPGELRRPKDVTAHDAALFNNYSTANQLHQHALYGYKHENAPRLGGSQHADGEIGEQTSLEKIATGR